MADAWGGSWGGTFVVWEAVEQVTEPVFGEPFLDAQTVILTAIGADTPFVTTLGRRTRIVDTIEQGARFPSTRISKSLT